MKKYFGISSKQASSTIHLSDHLIGNDDGHSKLHERGYKKRELVN